MEHERYLHGMETSAHYVPARIVSVMEFAIFMRRKTARHCTDIAGVWSERCIAAA